MIRKSLCLLLSFALTSSIITKQRMDKYVEMRTSEGDVNSSSEYCAGLLSAQVCNYCYASFLVNGKCLVPNKQVDHCLSYFADGQCELCQYNFGLKDGKCEKISIANCIETEKDDITKCVSCADSHLISTDGQCDTKTKCGVKNCQVCGSRGDIQYCSLCADNYVLAVGTDSQQVPFFECIAETDLIQNCDNVSSDRPAECMQCKLNYFMNEEKKCVKSTSYELDLYGKGVYKLVASLLVFLALF